MAKYDSVADLRAALTSNDADQRSDAYSAVLTHDIEPKQVLSEDPPTEALQKAGVIPGEEERMTRNDRLDRIVELLESIKANTGGS